MNAEAAARELGRLGLGDALALVELYALKRDLRFERAALRVRSPRDRGARRRRLPWHVHPDEDEWFYVLDGEFTFHVGDAQLTLLAGGFAFGPKAVPHTFIAGPDGGRALVGFQPSHRV
jgi:mannose-6-phosphate isomerase-like protein (cupin superfamily)